VRRVHAGPWGPADTVTLLRALIGVAVAILVVRSFSHDVPAALVVVPSSVALALDAVDGWVARRTGTTSRFGARFDMETDAGLLLVLSTYVAGQLGLWVMAIGLARYVFVAAKLPLPWLRGEAPPRPWCKVVAAVQGVVLLVAATGLLPDAVATGLLLVALALLTESFAHEAWDLWRIRVPHQSAPWASRLAGIVACLVVWAALVAPDDVAALHPTAFARVPIELLILLGVALLLPARAGNVVVLVGGVALGVLTLLKLLDLGVSVAFARPFDPLGDPIYLGAGVSFLRDAMGTANAYTVTVLAVALMVAVLLVVPFAVRRAAQLARGHRAVAGPALLALTMVWVGCAVVGVRVGGGQDVAAATELRLAAAHVTAVRDELRERAELAREMANDPYANVRAPKLLRYLSGKDVLLVFIESYGKVALDGLPTSPELRASVDDDSARLSRAGFHTRSAFLTSPTFGAMSWFAHSTLQSGLWIDNQSTYDLLLHRDRLTLSSAFLRAGWRSVGMVPANTEPWPEGTDFYHWQHLYDSTNMGYEGPRFGYGRMPDQFALEAFRRLELDRPGRGPLMAEIDLETSHNPWAPLPRMIDPADLGDGSVFDPMPDEGDQRDWVWSSPTRVKAAYVQSLQYSLDALTSFAEQQSNDDLVIITLGDHWPVTTVSGTTAGHEVPISVIARDPRVVRRIAGWNWQDGLRPRDDAPVWRMDAFRDKFLDAFSG
jgi:phosphatidylglycerophosphate synthase